MILSADGEATLAAESQGTRLGVGLQESGHLDPDARARTLAAIGSYVDEIREHKAELVATIATSAMRRASDGAAFAAQVERASGVPLRILSGQEEAMYSFLGATHHVRASDPVGVLDVGGGSSELAVDVPAQTRAHGRLAYGYSAEIGAVRLAEHHPAFLGAAALDAEQRAALLGESRAEVAPILARYREAPHPSRLIVVGGTAFTAAAMIADAPLRDGVVMTAAQRSALLEDLLARTLDERKAMPYMRPQRADILPAGLAIIDEACRMLGIGDVTVSVDDLLAGYLRNSSVRA